MPEHLKVINYDNCEKYFHVKCCNISKVMFLNKKENREPWVYQKCISVFLPISNLDNNELFLEANNLSVSKSDDVISMPSFTIQSLVDQMLGQNFETDEFMGETILSKYFTPEFLESKWFANNFSMIHINITWLSKHIDELRGLLTVLNHPFDIIGITETRLRDDNSLVNIEIDGYIFKHSPTKTACGRAGMYVKSSYEFDIKQNLSKSCANISESIFIEIKRSHKCYYWVYL